MPTPASWLPTDKQKREVYDRFGEEGLKGGMPPGGGGMPGGMAAGGMPGGMPQGFRFNPRSAEDIFAEVGPGSHVVQACCTGVCSCLECGTAAYMGRSLSRWGSAVKAGLGPATSAGWQHAGAQQLRLCTVLQPLGWARSLDCMEDAAQRG